jgi:hypothetical protein
LQTSFPHDDVRHCEKQRKILAHQCRPSENNCERVTRSATGARHLVSPNTIFAKIIKPHVVDLIINYLDYQALHPFELSRREKALEDATLHRRPEVIQGLVQARPATVLRNVVGYNDEHLLGLFI